MRKNAEAINANYGRSIDQKRFVLMYRHFSLSTLFCFIIQQNVAHTFTISAHMFYIFAHSLFLFPHICLATSCFDREVFVRAKVGMCMRTSKKIKKEKLRYLHSHKFSIESVSFIAISALELDYHS